MRTVNTKQNDQKAFLNAIKQAIEARMGSQTWDEIAALAGVEPRALKTYRMPASSTNYRQMPAVVRQAFESLLTQPVKSSQQALALVPALAWLVLSQARVSLIDRQIVSGLDRRRGSRNGLLEDERKIMAMVSRHCLIHDLPDYGGEIHILLQHCTLPFGEWLRIPEIIAAGYGETSLIQVEDGIPTPEAEELAASFTTLTAYIEEELFSKLKEALGKCTEEAGNDYYTSIREFIVRNPVVLNDKLFEAGKSIPSTLWMAIQQEYYEPVPRALATGGMITLCAHCNSLMRPVGHHLRCQSRACSSSRQALPGAVHPVDDCRRVTRGIRQYWVEPGIDEVRLYDDLKAQGLKPDLYPKRDLVDIAIGRVGIDLKAYVSPEILGAKFSRGLGGLAHYERKWLVIPDWLVSATPNYLDRLSSALGAQASRIRCLSVSEAARLAAKEA